MYSNAHMCRELTPLLEDNADPSDTELRQLIRDSESKLNLWLSARYATPVYPTSYLTGTITVNEGDTSITGVSTTFTNRKPGEVIQIVSTGEVLRIESVISDTEMIAASEVIHSASASSFWVVPDELVTASKYMATHIMIMLYFSEKTINQDNVEKFDNRLKYFADDIIKRIEKGDYLNTDLTQQTEGKSAARLLYINTSSDNRERIESTQDILLSDYFR